MESLFGLYRGIVKRHEKNGRCKVYIPGVYPKEWSLDANLDKLPDAEQLSPLFGGSNGDNGVFSYPNLNTVVACSFWNGDQNLPVFWGATLGKTANYTNAKVMPGSGVKNDAFVHKVHVKNSDIEISEGGNINIFTKDNTGDHTCKINLSDSGLITIDSTTMVVVKSSQINMEATERFDIHSPVINIGGLNGESAPQVNIKAVSLECDCSKGGVVVKSQFGNTVK